MCAGGVPERTFDHAKNVLEFAVEMLEAIKRFNQNHKMDLRVRVGINSGSVVAGVIGSKKFTFDVWGDAVNVASRMESTGVPNQIQVSQTTYDLLKKDYLFEERGQQQVKGKGLMITYLYRGRLSEVNYLEMQRVFSRDQKSFSSASLSLPDEIDIEEDKEKHVE